MGKSAGNLFELDKHHASGMCGAVIMRNIHGRCADPLPEVHCDAADDPAKDRLQTPAYPFSTPTLIH